MDRNGSKERPNILNAQDRRFAAFDDMGWTLDRRGRIGRNDLAHHQVIKEHLDSGQVLLDRLRRARVLFDIGRDVHRRDEPNVVKVLLGPRQKLSAGSGVSLTGVQVPDPGREKLEELGGSVFARIGQDRGDSVSVAQGQCVHSGVKEMANVGVLTGSRMFIFFGPLLMYHKGRYDTIFGEQGMTKILCDLGNYFA